MSSMESADQLYLKDTAFQDLMQRRVFNVLLIASPYDAFMMEEDGRVDEQLYFEYVSLNLSSPPRITRVAHIGMALEVMETKHFDLIIAMPGVEISETFTGARELKDAHPDVPIVVLTPFSKEVSRRLAHEDLSAIDYVFSWLGNVDLLLAIIKLLEDSMNAEDDVNGVGVQAILLVEDSVRFYSSVLPHLYKFLLKQSREFSTEALNEHEQMLRMRGRPKVILARTYEEAIDVYGRFGQNMLGVITDVSFMREGKKDQQAGLRLARYIREHDPYLPIIVESSEVANAERVKDFNGIFLDKNSKKLPVDLGDAITRNFGFGDFVMRNPETKEEIMRIRSLNEMQNRLYDIPAETLFYHASRNDISRWLYSRAMFPIADIIKHHRFRSLDETDEVRQFYFDMIVRYRRMKNRGVVAVFRKDRFDHYSNFARIGQGSLGGKGRGLAFIDAILKRNPHPFGEDVTLQIPRTVVLCTDIFDEFMSLNELYPVALSDLPDNEILAHFLKAELPSHLLEDFIALYDVTERPLAIRSSSLLEDSHYQPFAGVYSTYMIPHCDDRRHMMSMLADAIKGVYASVFYADSKAYMAATSNVIDQEKMAVIIQEVVGENHDGFYYPSFSGVGRSLNYYPINDERATDGVAQVAVGLGKTIVDGGVSLRFSPKHPNKVLQTSTLELALRDTQRDLYALDCRPECLQKGVVDDFGVVRIPVRDAAASGALRFMVSTFDIEDRMLRDSDYGTGRKVVTFANMLHHDAFPLAQAIDFMLTTGAGEMARPVEIEFAGQVDGRNCGKIYWLQIRPIVDRKNMVDDRILDTPDSELILRSHSALGNGNVDGVRLVVYVRPENFSALNNMAIAQEIEKINRNFTAQSEQYVLIGPGRWGSSDSALGVPVRWPQISNARVIVETALNNYRIEPSQGTHFFQNLTSLGVGYLTIDPFAPDGGMIDMDYINSMTAEYESENLRVVRFAHELSIAINGRRGVGVIGKDSIETAPADD